MAQKPLPPQRLGAHQALQVRAAVSGLRQWREDFGVDRSAYPRPAVGAERRGLQQLAHGAARCTVAVAGLPRNVSVEIELVAALPAR